MTSVRLRSAIGVRIISGITAVVDIPAIEGVPAVFGNPAIAVVFDINKKGTTKNEVYQSPQQ
jgi:hypothetical protein